MNSSSETRYRRGRNDKRANLEGKHPRRLLGGRKQGRENSLQVNREAAEQGHSVLPALALQHLETTVSSTYMEQREDRRIRTPSTHEHHWQQLGSPKSDPREGIQRRLNPSRCTPTAGLSFCKDAKLEHLCLVSLRPTQTTAGPGRGWGSPDRAAQLQPPSPEVVMNCRKTPLRGVRMISIKHNFLMQRLQGGLVELIRIEYSLQPALRVGARGLVPGST